MNDSSYWQRKLAAFLHDPPEKALDIARHETIAARYQTVARGLPSSDESRKTLLDSVKACDVFDAAIERFGLPKIKCTHDFAGNPRFVHPPSSFGAVGRRTRFRPDAEDARTMPPRRRSCQPIPDFRTIPSGRT